MVIGTDRPIAARVRSHGRGRVAEALFTVALDTLDPSARSDLCADEWDRVHELLREPVDDAAAAALAVLIDEMEARLAQAPPTLLARLEQLRIRAELGGE